MEFTPIIQNATRILLPMTIATLLCGIASFFVLLRMKQSGRPKRTVQHTASALLGLTALITFAVMAYFATN